MNHVITPSDVESAVRSLIAVTETSLGIEIVTPVVYPDGQAITVVVSNDGDEYVVHDAGFGSMYLTNLGVRLSGNLRRRVAELVLKYECEYVDGRVTRRCRFDQIAVAVALTANASRSVADQSLEIRHRSEAEFVESVNNTLLTIVGKRLRTNEPVKGKSGRQYQVRNVILDAKEHDVIAFVETIAHRSTVERRFTEFHDLRGAFPQTWAFSVYDDTDDLQDTHISLLREACEPLTFSSSQERFRELAA